jgi:hypothetical protein
MYCALRRPSADPKLADPASFLRPKVDRPRWPVLKWRATPRVASDRRVRTCPPRKTHRLSYRRKMQFRPLQTAKQCAARQRLSRLSALSMSFKMTLPFLLCGSAPAVETNHDRRRGLPCAFLQGQQLPLPTQTLTEATAMLGEYTTASHCEQGAGNDHYRYTVARPIVWRATIYEPVMMRPAASASPHRLGDRQFATGCDSKP